jgi:hypothetical protein
MCVPGGLEADRVVADLAVVPGGRRYNSTRTTNPETAPSSGDHTAVMALQATERRAFPLRQTDPRGVGFE